jgi:hypothetical protein
MEDKDQIINKVAGSSIVTIDLEKLYPQGKRTLFDLKDFLFEALILKEKDFREKLKLHDWHQYQGQYVALTCTADAIIPTWAYMLVTVRLEPVAKKVFFGSLQQMDEALFAHLIAGIDPLQYQDQRVVIKGCSHTAIPQSAYIDITARLRPYVKSIMFGEPCSTVPVYKKM